VRFQEANRFQNGFFARGGLAHSFGFFGGGLGGLAASALPGGTKVAQVIPDSGLYWAVFPGAGGMRIK
jgi:hypothetical protein